MENEPPLKRRRRNLRNLRRTEESEILPEILPEIQYEDNSIDRDIYDLFIQNVESDNVEDNRDMYDFFYEHFNNYRTHYIPGDRRIELFNDSFKYNYKENGEEFINNLMNRFIKNGYNFSSKDDFIRMINSKIKDMESGNYLNNTEDFLVPNLEKINFGLPERLETIFEEDEEKDYGRRKKSIRQKSKSKKRKSKSRRKRKSKSKKRKSKSRRKSRRRK